MKKPERGEMFHLRLKGALALLFLLHTHFPFLLGRAEDITSSASTRTFTESTNFRAAPAASPMTIADCKVDGSSANIGLSIFLEPATTTPRTSLLFERLQVTSSATPPSIIPTKCVASSGGGEVVLEFRESSLFSIVITECEGVKLLLRVVASTLGDLRIGPDVLLGLEFLNSTARSLTIEKLQFTPTSPSASAMIAPQFYNNVVIGDRSTITGPVDITIGSKPSTTRVETSTQAPLHDGAIDVSDLLFTQLTLSLCSPLRNFRLAVRNTRCASSSQLLYCLGLISYGASIANSSLEISDNKFSTSATTVTGVVALIKVGRFLSDTFATRLALIEGTSLRVANNTINGIQGEVVLAASLDASSWISYEAELGSTTSSDTFITRKHTLEIVRNDANTNGKKELNLDVYRFWVSNTDRNSAPCNASLNSAVQMENMAWTSALTQHFSSMPCPPKLSLLANVVISEDLTFTEGRPLSFVLTNSVAKRIAFPNGCPLISVVDSTLDSISLSNEPNGLSFNFFLGPTMSNVLYPDILITNTTLSQAIKIGSQSLRIPLANNESRRMTFLNVAANQFIMHPYSATWGNTSILMQNIRTTEVALELWMARNVSLCVINATSSTRASGRFIGISSGFTEGSRVMLQDIVSPGLDREIYVASTSTNRALSDDTVFSFRGADDYKNSRLSFKWLVGKTFIHFRVPLHTTASIVMEQIPLTPHLHQRLLRGEDGSTLPKVAFISTTFDSRYPLQSALGPLTKTPALYLDKCTLVNQSLMIANSTMSRLSLDFTVLTEGQRLIIDNVTVTESQVRVGLTAAPNSEIFIRNLTALKDFLFLLVGSKTVGLRFALFHSQLASLMIGTTAVAMVCDQCRFEFRRIAFLSLTSISSRFQFSDFRVVNSTVLIDGLLPPASAPSSQVLYLPSVHLQHSLMEIRNVTWTPSANGQVSIEIYDDAPSSFYYELATELSQAVRYYVTYATSQKPNVTVIPSSPSGEAYFKPPTSVDLIGVPLSASLHKAIFGGPQQIPMSFSRVDFPKELPLQLRPGIGLSNLASTTLRYNLEIDGNNILQSRNFYLTEVKVIDATLVVRNILTNQINLQRLDLDHATLYLDNIVVSSINVINMNLRAFHSTIHIKNVTGTQLSFYNAGDFFAESSSVVFENLKFLSGSNSDVGLRVNSAVLSRSTLCVKNSFNTLSTMQSVRILLKDLAIGNSSTVRLVGGQYGSILTTFQNSNDAVADSSSSFLLIADQRDLRTVTFSDSSRLMVMGNAFDATATTVTPLEIQGTKTGAAAFGCNTKGQDVVTLVGATSVDCDCGAAWTEGSCAKVIGQCNVPAITPWTPVAANYDLVPPTLPRSAPALSTAMPSFVALTVPAEATVEELPPEGCGTVSLMIAEPSSTIPVTTTVATNQPTGTPLTTVGELFSDAPTKTQEESTDVLPTPPPPTDTSLQVPTTMHEHESTTSANSSSAPQSTNKHVVASTVIARHGTISNNTSSSRTVSKSHDGLESSTASSPQTTSTVANALGSVMPASVATAYVATGSASAGLSAAAGAPGLATQVAKVNSITRSTQCDVSPDVLSPALYEHPIQFSLGGDSSYSLLSGAVVGSTLLVFAPTVGLLATYFLFGKETVATERPTTALKALSALTTVVVGYLGPSVVAGASTLIVHTDIGLHRIAASVCALTVVGLTAFLAWLTMSKFAEHIRVTEGEQATLPGSTSDKALNSSATKKIDFVSLTDNSAGFLEAFSAFFDAGRSGALSVRIHYFVDLLIAMAGSAASSLLFGVACWFPSVFVLVLALLNTAYLFVVQPYRTKMDRVFATACAVLQVVLALFGFLASRAESLEPIFVWALIAQSCAFYVQAVGNIVWQVYLRKRRQRRREVEQQRLIAQQQSAAAAASQKEQEENDTGDAPSPLPPSSLLLDVPLLCSIATAQRSKVEQDTANHSRSGSRR